ncbi:MAG: hypothetical protein Fur0022_03300 [Anaerolineales bacterium]
MNFPVYLSSFIGRKNETDELISRLQAKASRLLTLTGPGGSGKTRLAAEILPNLKDVFEDGLIWVELAGLSDPAALPQTVASALGVNAVPGQTLLNTLITTLQPREMLIILDNGEHLLEACASLIEVLVRACPALYWMVTSRQMLGIEGEQRWPVPPLSYSTDNVLPLETLSNYESVQLFTARARQIHPSFEIHQANAPAVLKISQLLEGIPLAIELAAAWVNVLDVGEIASRLENQLTFLAKRQASTDTRHRSMRETIRWSYELLSDAEKTLFHRLGVFVGGFSINAVEKICPVEALGQAEILELVARLVDQSLVVREQGRGGESRYRQLEAIRQYACEKLEESDEKAHLQDQHLGFFVDLVRKAEPHLQGAEQRHWTERLDADYENLQAALFRAIHKAENGDAPSHAIQLGLGLFWFWNYTDRHEIGREWDEKVLQLPGFPLHSPEHADLLRHRATFTWLLGDYPTAHHHLQQSLEIAEAIGYRYCRAHVKLLLGIMAVHQGRAEQAISLLQECERHFRELGNMRELIIAQTNLGGVFLEIGQLETAHSYAREAVARAQTNQDMWGLGLALSGLGDIFFKKGDFDAARQNMEASIEVFQKIGQKWLLAEAIWRLANMQETLGDFEQAEKQMEWCFTLAQDGGALQWEIAALESLGRTSLRRGHDPQAAGYFLSALQLAPRREFIALQLRVFAGIVQLAAHAQQWPQAATLWGAYEAVKTTHQLAVLPDEATIRALLSPQLAAPVVGQAFQVGQTKSLEETALLAFEIATNVKAPRVVSSSKYDLRLLALGPAEVYLQDQLLVASDWTFAKPKELLFYLASSSPQTKEQLGLVFWPDASPGQLRVSLRAALYHLRRALGARDWILYENGRYRFNRKLNYWYDLEAFETNLAEAEQTASQTDQIEKYEHALCLYRGDFLEGITSNEWGTIRREELARKYRAAMNTLAACHLDLTAFDRALEIYHTLLNTDPLEEETHRGVMRAYARKGEIALALRQYQDLVKLLQDELGIRPSPNSKALYQRLQNGEKI